MNSPLLEVRDLVQRFGGIVATDHVSLSVPEGELHAIIGPNGAGKTTLMAQLFGERTPAAGHICFRGVDITRLGVAERVRMGIARSFQITTILEECSARDNVALGVQARQGHSFRFWRNARLDRTLSEAADTLLNEVGLGGAGDSRASELAHGARRQLELAMALALQPSLLLLDEPMAGMSAAESIEMTQLLLQLKRRHTILLVEHDMQAVFSLADRISVLVYGKVVACDTPDRIRANREVQVAYLGDDAT